MQIEFQNNSDGKSARNRRIGYIVANYNKIDYSAKAIGLLILSLIFAPVSGQTAADNAAQNSAAQTDTLENNAPDNLKIEKDAVLEDRATRTVFKMTQALPGILDFPAAIRKAETSPPQDPNAPAPITIEADKLSFSETTGDILAQGKVIITSNGEKIETEELNGNTKLSQVWTKKPVSFTTKEASFTSDDIFYDYKQKTGQIGQTRGKANKQFVSGKHTEITPDKYVITQGTTTGCPAQIPDYHISGEKIEIWPGDKIIIHKAKFWIKNRVIFNMDKYQASIKPGKEDDAPFPRIGYTSADGLYIKQHLEYPLNPATSLFTDLDYYSKRHFKPSYGIQNKQKNYTTQIVAGYHKDSDDNWVRKSPEFNWSYHTKRIGSTPLSYRLDFSYGKWIDDFKTSWHQSYNFYLNYDPIKLSGTTFLYFGGGLEHVRESYNGTQQNVPKFDATLTKAFSSRLNTWVSYHYKEYKIEPLFNYSVPDIVRELNYGFTYKIDRLNTIGVTYRYDTDKRALTDLNYTWYRNLHCWDWAITYKSKPQTWNWTMNIVHW